MNSQKQLAVFLSKLKVFEKPKRKLEQYPTDSESAAKLIWKAYMEKTIDEQPIIDLGCGTGILGIGALVMGANHCTFVDVDKDVKHLLEENIKFAEEYFEIDLDGEWTFIQSNVEDVNIDKLQSANKEQKTGTEEQSPENSKKPPVVFMNPPFGTSKVHADRIFLEQSKQAQHIYSMHKTVTRKFIQQWSSDNNFRITWSEDVSFLLKQTMKEHKKTHQRIEVTLFHLEKF